MSIPLVAIVGRPNVGKSTLFNRLVGGRHAVVSEQEKTTRDRNYGTAEWNGRQFRLVDTGGYLPDRDADRIDKLVVEQIRSAIVEADLVLFVVDGIAGVLPDDAETAQSLRRDLGNVILVGNKVDNEKIGHGLYEFLELGMGEAYPVSATHGVGVGDLLDEIVNALPSGNGKPESEGLKIGIIGKPNVGKSSLVNAYLGREQMIVSEIPGTTRDAVDSRIMWRKEPIILVDTAGLKRRSRVTEDIDYYSVLRTNKTIVRSDILFFLLDASEPITNQDARVASLAAESGKGVVLLLNKTDKDLPDQLEKIREEIPHRMPFLKFAPIVSISAETRRGIGRALDVAREVETARHEKIKTSKLNDIIEAALIRNAPPAGRGKNQIFYGTQTGVAPPTFLFFAKEPEAVPPFYRKYLIRVIRETYPYEGTPIFIHVRKRDRA